MNLLNHSQMVLFFFYNDPIKELQNRRVQIFSRDQLKQATS